MRTDIEQVTDSIWLISFCWWIISINYLNRYFQLIILNNLINSIFELWNLNNCCNNNWFNWIAIELLTIELMDLGIRQLEVKADINRNDVEEYFGLDGYGCHCVAWSSFGQVKSRRAKVVVACKSQFHSIPFNSIQFHSIQFNSIQFKLMGWDHQLSNSTLILKLASFHPIWLKRISSKMTVILK